MMKLIVAATCGLALAACATTGDDAAKLASSEPVTLPAGSTVEDVVEADPNAQICKKLKPPTGTRLSKASHQCATQAEWDRIAAEAEQSTRDIQDNSRYNLDSGN